MEYTTLTKLYYKNPSSYSEEYGARFSAPFTQHIPVKIHQYNRSHAYPAFFYYTNDVLLLLEKIGKTYGSFQGLIHAIPQVVQHQFALMSIVDEVKSTNDIEGVHSTRKEIADILDGHTANAKRLESVVHKYAELLQDKENDFATCQDIRRFYDEFTHEEIIKDNPAHKLDGKIFRRDAVSIESGTGKITHQGLYPEDKILEAMEQALGVLHATDLPVLIRLAVFHYLFAYIHPFYDGNGRTDRFITSYYVKRCYHRLIALRLSVYIKANRTQYYRLFEEADSEINRGDLTPFIIGFLKIIQGTIEDTIRILSRKYEQMKKYEEKIVALSGKDALLKSIYFILLQAALFYGRGISIAKLMELTKKNRATIKKRLDGIPQESLVIVKLGKTSYYKLNLLVFNKTGVFK